MAKDETEDVVFEAEGIIIANWLGTYMRDPANREAIRKRGKELIEDACNYSLTAFDILTQAALVKLWLGIEKEPITLVEIKFNLFLGYILGKEASDGN